MKKLKRNPVEIRKTPPPGWPSEEMWAEAEQKLMKLAETRVLPADASPVQRVKHELCKMFEIYVEAHNITQRELARRLDVGESRVSEILHYEHDTFTIDRLLELYSRIKPDVKIQVA